jgi:CBS domain-containing protein
MTRPVTVPTGIGIRAALRELSDTGGDEILVVDSRRRPVGVFAGERVAAEWCPEGRRTVRVGAAGEESDPEGWPLPVPTPSRVDELTVPIRAQVAAGATIAQACAAMVSAGCARAAVVSSSGRLVGVVTSGAVLTWIARSARQRVGVAGGDASTRLGD